MLASRAAIAWLTWVRSASLPARAWLLEKRRAAILVFFLAQEAWLAASCSRSWPHSVSLSSSALFAASACRLNISQRAACSAAAATAWALARSS